VVAAVTAVAQQQSVLVLSAVAELNKRGKPSASTEGGTISFYRRGKPYQRLQETHAYFFLFPFVIFCVKNPTEKDNNF
jgi:hypothetical protein